MGELSCKLQPGLAFGNVVKLGISMATKRKDGYKFSETAFGVFLAKEKKREGKFNIVLIFFAVVFGGPMVFLTLSLIWKGLAWIFSLI